MSARVVVLSVLALASASIAYAQEDHSHASHDPNAHCYSTCRTCEIGMTAGTGQTYSSIAYLVWDALCSED